MRQKRRGAHIAHQFIQAPEQFLVTILIGNNIAVVVVSTLMAIYLEQLMSGFIITLISAVLLLTFGEMLPKAIAGEQATTIAIRVSPLLRMIYFLSYPVVKVIHSISRALLRLIHGNPDQAMTVFSRQDMEKLIHEGERAGVVNEAERDLISRFILRGNLRVSDIMVPRTEMVAVPKNERVSQVRKIFEETGFSRLPVTGENEDDILGMVMAKDLILFKPRRISQVMRNILFVPETRNLIHFFTEFQEKPSGMAIVVDEYGGTAGLITFEDIVEEFFGEIQDEHDETISLVRKVTDKQIDVNARIEIHDLNAQFKLFIPDGEYNTLSGYLLDHFGHIPRRGEKVMKPGCTFTILSATSRQIKWVRIVKKEGGIQ